MFTNVLMHSYVITRRLQGIPENIEIYFKIWDASCVSLLQTSKASLLRTGAEGLTFKYEL